MSWTQIPTKDINEPYQKTHKFYNSDIWFCSDGDSAQLEIDYEDRGVYIQLFSGITGSSKINIDELDFGIFRHLYEDKLFSNDKQKNFEIIAFSIADYFCKLFCYKGINANETTYLQKLEAKRKIDFTIDREDYVQQFLAHLHKDIIGNFSKVSNWKIGISIDTISVKYKLFHELKIDEYNGEWIYRIVEDDEVKQAVIKRLTDYGVIRDDSTEGKVVYLYKFDNNGKEE